jgi:ribonuclease P protein component
MDIIRHTLTRRERLKSVKEISKLFESGKSFLVYPIKVVWVEAASDLPFPVQAAFSVSKRNFRHATDRNKLKRRMREAYRLNKFLLYEKLSIQKISCIFIYIAREELTYAVIGKSMKTALVKLGKTQLPDKLEI